MLDVVPTFGRGKEGERGGDKSRDVIEGTRVGGAKERFQFGKRLFDRIEIRTVRRQKPELRAGPFDGRADVGLAVHREVVEDDDVAAAQRRHQDLFHVREKARVIDRSIKHRWRGEAVWPQRRDDGVRLPMPARGVIAEPRTAWTPTIPSEQVGPHPAFIEEDVLPRVAERQPRPPAPPLRRDVGPALFVGVYRFF